MSNAFKAQMTGGAFALIAVFSAAAWAETPAPADLAEEDAYLDVLPKVEIPENVQPIPGAVNEEFRNCEAAWPAGYALARSGPEARALRDIYSFVRAMTAVSQVIFLVSPGHDLVTVLILSWVGYGTIGRGAALSTLLIVVLAACILPAHWLANRQRFGRTAGMG